MLVEIYGEHMKEMAFELGQPAKYICSRRRGQMNLEARSGDMVAHHT